MVLWLLGCVAPADTGSAETGPADGPGPGGWDVEEAPACASGASTPSWTRGAPYEPAWVSPTADHHFETGGVALLDTENGPFLAWTRPYLDAPWAMAPMGPDGAPAGAMTVGAAAGGARALATGDVDGDGRVDLVVIGSGLTVVTAVGTDDQAEHSVPLDRLDDRTYLADAAVLDLNGDGLDDLVPSLSNLDWSAANDQPYVALSYGDGTFVVADVTGSPNWARGYDVVPVMLAEEALPELLLCTDNGQPDFYDRLLENPGDGALADAVDQRGLDVNLACMGGASGDIDGDGTVDLLLADVTRMIWLDLGGTFIDGRATNALALQAFPSMPWGAAVTDLANDGVNDLVVAESDFWYNGGGGVLQWFTRDGAAWVDEGPRLSPEAGGWPKTLVARDLNGDGVQDLIIGDSWHGPTVLLSEGCTAAGWLDVEAPTGTRIEVTAGDTHVVAAATTDAGWASAGPAVAHLGLGDVAEVDAVHAWLPFVGEVTLPGPIPARSRLRWHDR